jgi:hypothetical protein
MIVVTLTILLVAVVVGMQVVQGDGTPSGGGGTHTRSGGRHGQFVRVAVVVAVITVGAAGVHRIRRHRVGELCIDLIPDLRTVRILTATTTGITATITGIRLMEIDE